MSTTEAKSTTKTYKNNSRNNKDTIQYKNVIVDIKIAAAVKTGKEPLTEESSIVLTPTSASKTLALKIAAAITQK